MLRSAVPPNLPPWNEDPFSGSDKPLRCNGRPRLPILAFAFCLKLRSVLPAVSCAGLPPSPALCGRASAVLFSLDALLSVLGVSTFAEMQRGRRGLPCRSALAVDGAIISAVFFPCQEGKLQKKYFPNPILEVSHKKGQPLFFFALCLLRDFCTFCISQNSHSNSWTFIFLHFHLHLLLPPAFQPDPPQRQGGNVEHEQESGHHAGGQRVFPGPESRSPSPHPEEVHKRMRHQPGSYSSFS